MSQFILDTDGVVTSETGDRTPFFALPLLTQGFIKALFWTNTDGSRERGTYDPETGGALPEEVGYDDLAGSTLAVIVADCDAFAAQAADAIAEANERGYSDESIGTDFLLTRTGSGSNFSDRDELGLIGDDKAAVNALYAKSNAAYEADPESDEYRTLWAKANAESKRLEAGGPAERLNAAARAFGDFDVYLGDDGKVYA